MVHDRYSGSRATDTDVDAYKITTPKMLYQALQSIMAGRGATLPDPDHPQGQVHLVKDDDHVGARLGGKVFCYRPTVIHKGQWLDQ